MAEGVPGHLGVLPDGGGGGGAVGQEEGEAAALGVLLLLLLLLLELLVEELGSQGAEGLAIQLELLQAKSMFKNLLKLYFFKKLFRCEISLKSSLLVP